MGKETVELIKEEKTIKKFIKSNKTICILINEQGKVYYSNTDLVTAHKYLESIRIFDYLHISDTVSYDVKDCNITVNKIILDEVYYYLILIQQQENIFKYAYKDLLTGLYNRNYWEHFLSDIQYYRLPKKLTLIIIDVDNLKQINDNKGHLFGDRAIQIVGQAIRKSIRKSDIGVRYGGDEFFILLESTKMSVAKKVVNRIRANISKKGKKENIHIRISAGIACYDCIKSIGDMIKMADKNLYKQKRAKKSKEGQNSEKIMYLRYEIQKLKDELNRKITQGGKGINNNEEILKLSQKLDKLIVDYLQMKDKR